jgi:hypothetical protein
VLEEFDQRAGRLDAARSASSDHEGELSAVDPVRIAARGLEAREHMGPEVDRVGEALQAERVLGDSRDPVVGGRGSDGEDQEVVRDPTLSKRFSRDQVRPETVPRGTRSSAAYVGFRGRRARSLGSSPAVATW